MANPNFIVELDELLRRSHYLFLRVFYSVLGPRRDPDTQTLKRNTYMHGVPEWATLHASEEGRFVYETAS
jgi:hypothetical protein